MEDLGVDGRMIITTWIFKNWEESLKWIHQDPVTGGGLMRTRY